MIDVADLPCPPAASCLPSGLKARERIPPMECRRCTGSHVYIKGASIVVMDFPLSTSHTTICPTLSAVASCLPLGEKAAVKSMEG